MKEIVETYYCDICNEQIDITERDLSPTYININHLNSGGRIKYEHVCQKCSQKIYELIKELIILKTNNI